MCNRFTKTMLAVLAVGLAADWSEYAHSATPAVATATKNPLDALRAYRYLEQLCALGPRYSGSPGMQKQQELLVEHFKKLGGQVSLQEFRAKNPLGGTVSMANIIVQWHPERK